MIIIVNGVSTVNAVIAAAMGATSAAITRRDSATLSPRFRGLSNTISELGEVEAFNYDWLLPQGRTIASVCTRR